jgi:TRAP-type C4-dicarboxylate transport system permease small subunit
MFRAFTAWYARLLSWLLALSVAVLIIPVSLQVFSRYTQLIPAYIWTEEMARFLFIWMVMIGAMIGVREGSHFEVDVWPDLGPKATAVLQLAASVLILLFAFVFLWAGWEFTRFAWNRVSELADLPLWMIHIAWPATGLAWFVFQSERMWDAAMVLAGRAQPKAEVKQLEAAE